MAPHHRLRASTATSRTCFGTVVLALLALVLPAVATTASATAPAPEAPAGQPAQPISAPTSTADVPVYRDPPGYRGWKKAPRTREVTGPRVRLSTTGTHPDVTVDEAGTGHVVWNEGRGDDADATMYCRLERAASTCDVTRTLLWDKTYGAGDGPQYNIDDGGPRVVQVGEQLLALSHRYPTMGVKPDGASSSTTVGWVSNDGGTTWSDAAILGKRNLGQLSVVGPDDDPMIGNLAHDPFCGGTCMVTFRSGTYDPSEAVLNPDPDADYHASLVTDGPHLVAAMSDAGVKSDGEREDPPYLWLRRWNGVEPATVATNWTTSGAIEGDEPDLAAGPEGVFLLHRRLDSLEIPAELTVRAVEGQVPAPGPGTVISGPRVREGQLVQDGRGHLHAVWVEAGTGVRMRAGEAAGIAFRPPTTVIGGDTNGQLGISTARDGGGFVVLNHTGGVTQPGEIVAAGVGSLAPTGEPGLGDLPGGGNITCQQVDFGDFEVETVEGCFLKGIGENRSVVVTRGAVTLNGLEIVPTEGSQLVIDAEKLTIDTIGQARVLLRNGDAEIELFRGRVHRDLKDVGPGTPLFEFPQAEYQADVLGFPVASGLLVTLTADGVRIPVELRLPAVLGGFTAQAVLLGLTGQGLVLDSLKVRMGPIPLGVMNIDEVRLDWQSGGTWTGGGKLTMPLGSLEADIGFVGGDFDFATFDYYPLPVVTLAPFVYLTRVGGGLDVQPEVVITAGGDVGMGAPVRELTPVEATGQFTMTFPRSGPASFRLDGGVELFAISIGEGYVEFRTDGYAQFGGDTTLSLGPLSGGVRVDGFVDATGGQFGAELSAGVKYCTWVKDPAGVQPDREVCSTAGGVEAVVSSIGFAACAEVDPDPLPSFSIGLAQKWEDVEPALLVNPYLATAEILSAVATPCETGPYQVPNPAGRAATARRAAEAGGAGFAVPGGLPSATFLVPGQGGVPDVEVTAPDGTTLVGPGASGAGVRLLALDDADAVWVVVDDPLPGDYVIVPRPGSVALGDVSVSEGLAVATVTGEVSRGRIDYRAKRLAGGQQITFVERGDFGTNVLGTRSKAAGTLRFRPASGPGGRRVIEAQVVLEGLPKRTVTLGSYKVADPTPPGAVKRLAARHRRSAVTVTYRAPGKAEQVEVRVTGSAGSSVMRSVPAGKRKVVLKGFRWDKRITVTVRTRGDDGLLGPKRVVRLK